MKTVKLICKKCGCKFDRESKYVKYYGENPRVIVFKWKVEFCDKCYKERVSRARKRLPDLIKKLIE